MAVSREAVYCGAGAHHGNIPLLPDHVPQIYIERVAQIESGGNPLAKAKTSSALGLYQFVTGTWDGIRKAYPELRLTPDGRTNPAQAERAFRRFTADNAEAFRKKAGRTPDLAELYLMHFLGAPTAIAACMASPHALASAFVSAGAIKANPSIFKKGLTCGDLRAWAGRKLGTASVIPMVARVAAAAAPTADDLNRAELARIRSEQVNT